MLIPDSSGTHNDTSKVPACTKKKYMQAFSSGACRHPLSEHAGILFRNMQASSSGACRHPLQVHAGMLCQRNML